MKIQRVRIKGEDVTIEYREEAGGHVKTTKDRGSQPPTPEFIQAFEALKPFVAKLVGVSMSWMCKVIITGVTYAEKDDTLGVVITATRPCTLTNAPLNIATPVYWLEVGMETDFSIGLAEATDAVEHEAAAYICGQVAQLSLVSDDDSDPVPEFDDEESTVDDRETVGA